MIMSSMAENELVNDKKQLHIVMFPWLAFGHMIPYLNLAKRIAEKGHRVSFVSTPRNIDRLPPIPATLSSHLLYVRIPLPPVTGLPDSAEATNDLPYHQVPLLKKAYDGLQDPVALFLEASTPDWVMNDFAAHWMGPLAAGLGIRTAFFCIFIAACVGFTVGPTEALFYGGDNGRKNLEDFSVPAPWSPPGSTTAFRMYEIKRIKDSFSDNNDSGISDLLRLAGSVVNCDVIAIRSSPEFEPEWLRVIEEINKKAVFPVGQLAPFESDLRDDDEKETESWREIKKWLDSQGKGSVVYVAFGSETKPSQEELTNIALGLEKSGLPFFWVLKRKSGPHDPELPAGFEERTEGRGWVCQSWAPQLKILSHDSVGGFLSHAGWSSVVEAVYLEKPLILLSFLADQGIISRVLEEKQMGYPIPRDEKDGSFTSDSVAESLRRVMVEEEGRMYMEKMKEMKGCFCDKERQDKYVDTLLTHFRTRSTQLL